MTSQTKLDDQVQNLLWNIQYEILFKSQVMLEKYYIIAVTLLLQMT